VIDDDDDWPQPCPKPDANGKHLPDLFCGEQCVAEGATVPTIGTSVAEALPSLLSEVSTVMSLFDGADKLLLDGAVTADVVSAGVSTTSQTATLNLMKRLNGREAEALRTLGLLKEEDTDNGRSSRRAMQQIERWVAASASVAVEVDEPLFAR
jgi:hypothetical protein